MSKKITFLKNTFDKQLKDVVVLLEDFFNALERRDIATLNSMLSEDASIQSWSRGFILQNKAEYLEDVQNHIKLRVLQQLRFTGVTLEEIGEDTVVACGFLGIHSSQNTIDKINGYCIFFRKTGETFLIEKTEYSTRNL